MNAQFGDSYAQSVAKDFVFDQLGGRTVERALADGVDAKVVWRARLRHLQGAAESALRRRPKEPEQARGVDLVPGVTLRITRPCGPTGAVKACPVYLRDNSSMCRRASSPSTVSATCPRTSAQSWGSSPWISTVMRGRERRSWPAAAAVRC